MKRRIKLTENELHRMIKESVKKVINEVKSSYRLDPNWDDARCHVFASFINMSDDEDILTDFINDLDDGTIHTLLATFDMLAI